MTSIDNVTNKLGPDKETQLEIKMWASLYATPEGTTANIPSGCRCGA